MPALQDHPLAAIFPLMGDDELKALAADIEANGLREPIWLLDGMILDGRNRYRACELIGDDFDLSVRHYQGDDPLGFVVSKNLHRRHLTASQRAMVAANIATAKRGGDRDKSESANLRNGELNQSQAAELLNVSTRTVTDAAKVREKGDPELVKAVEAGKVPVSTAAKVADLPKSEQKKVARSAKPKKAAAKAAGKKDEPPAETDAWGIPIQPHAAEAFAAVPAFKELLATIALAQRQFNALANLPGGKFLQLPDVSSYRRGKKGADGEHADRFVHEGLERALQQVKNAVPTHTVCPYQYADAPHPKDCRTCKGLNWTPPLGGSIPKTCIDRAKADLIPGEGE